MIKKTLFLIKQIFTYVFFTAFPKIVLAGDEFSRSCPTLEEYTQDGVGENFILKEPYELIMQACASIAEGSWAAFASSLQGVVCLGAAIYIALYTLKNIGSFSQQDTSAYLSNEKTGVIPLGIKTAIVITLLGNQSTIYTYLITPVIGAGTDVGKIVAGSSLGSGGFSGASSVRALFSSVIKQVMDFNNQIYKIVGIGKLLWCVAKLPDSLPDWYWRLLFFAPVLILYGWIILLGVSFAFIDVLFRLAVGCIMLPMGIACGFSKLTSSYTKSLWNLFVNVCFTFMSIGILVSFTTEMIWKALGGTDKLKAQLAGKVLNKADVDAFVENINLTSFLLVSICCILAVKLFMGLDQIVEGLSSARSVGSLGKKTGAQAFATTKKAAAFVSQPVRVGGAVIGQRAGNKIVNSKPITAVRRGYRAVGSSMKKGVKKVFGLS